jgi:predicted ATPase
VAGAEPVDSSRPSAAASGTGRGRPAATAAARVNNAKLSCLFYLGFTLWLQGRPDQALKRIRDVLDLAQGLSSVFSLTAGFSAAALIHQLRGEEQAGYERAEAGLSLATQHGYPHWIAMGTLLRGWALAQQGQRDTALAEMHQGLAALRALGTGVALPHYLALLANVYRQTGQADKGFTLLSEAVALVHQTGERCWEAELYRLQGELLLARSEETQAEAEACFSEALTLARRQQAQSWELRTVTSLARLWSQQNKTQDAYELLACTYSRFTEGFATADLREARALLDKLQRSHTS